MNRETEIKEEVEIEEGFECSVCQDILYRPVTIQCGHTFCKECIAKALQINPQCPFCRSPCFVQDSGLKENVTLKSIIETKYSAYIKRKEKSQKPEEKKSNNVEQHQEILDFNPMPVISLAEAPKKQLFPNTLGQITVRINYDLKYFWQLCPERKCLALLDHQQQEGFPHTTCIFEIRELKPEPKKNVYKANVRVLNRVHVDRVNYMELTSDMEGYSDLEEKLTLAIGHGKFFKDEFPSNFDLVLEKSNDLIELLNMKLRTMFEVSNSIGQMVAHNVAPLITLASQGTLDYITDFSFGLSHLINATPTEKQALFEETNLLKRLILLKSIADRYDNKEDPVAMFEFEIPGSRAFASLGASLIVLVLIIVGLLFNKFFMKNHYY